MALTMPSHERGEYWYRNGRRHRRRARTADAALTHNRLIELAGMIELSRATLAIIRQNVVLALGLKAVFLVTSLLGITGLWMAVLADSGATALVTLNALRLLKFRSSTSE